MRLFLQPFAIKNRHSGSFYRGFRLIGLDGSEFSLRNSKGVLTCCTKAVSRRLEAAFAKVRTSVLVELGLHNPVAAEIARNGESEWELSLRLVRKLPANSLLLADRLYGCPAFIKHILEHSKGSKFLIRTRTNLIVKRIEKLQDGSRLVEISIRTSRSHKIKWKVTVREIRASVGRRGHRHQKIRLWTNLVNEKQCPADELVQLYAKRWEHELYYREVKHELRQGELLHSQTLETACQEIAAILIATSIVAQHRTVLAENGHSASVTAFGFRRALLYTQQMWYLLLCAEGVLSQKQTKQLARRMRDLLSPDKIPKKRQRSCPRVVRQPVKGWPRKLNHASKKGNLNVTIF